MVIIINLVTQVFEEVCHCRKPLLDCKVPVCNTRPRGGFMSKVHPEFRHNFQSRYQPVIFSQSDYFWDCLLSVSFSLSISSVIQSVFQNGQTPPPLPLFGKLLRMTHCFDLRGLRIWGVTFNDLLFWLGRRGGGS